MKVRIVAVILLVPVVALAEEQQKFWSTDVELGAVFTSGNTEQETVNFRVDAKREKNSWINAVHLDTLQASQDDDDTADKLYMFYRLDYRLDEGRGLFGRVAYEDDAFSGFEEQVDVTFGYNQTLLQRDNLFISGDVGLGAKYIKLESTGEDSTDTLLRVAGLLEWDVSDNAVFKQLLEFEVAEDLTTTRSETSLESSIAGNLAMKLAYNVRHNSEVAAGKDKTDTESTVSLVYHF